MGGCVFNKTIKIMKNKIITLFILPLLMTTSMKAQPLQTVPNVDLNRYVGKWFEIASFPQRFQKRCHCTTAEYTPTDKGYIMVENRCNKDSVNGKQSSIKGKAFVVENTGNAQLKVQFFWPFKGDYWIIDLADDYSYAVVSDPKKKSLWILSRTPKMEDTRYQQVILKLKDKGFDLTNLKITPQQQ
jgi:apolipoprotein D and lipocalin family protein